MVDMYNYSMHSSSGEGYYSSNIKVLCVIVATVTFGMGLDCLNVCHIIKKDIETFIQETGQAGRDKFPATAKFFSAVKVLVLMLMIK